MRKFLLARFSVLTKVFAIFFANTRPIHPALAPIVVETRIRLTQRHPVEHRRLY